MKHFIETLFFAFTCHLTGRDVWGHVTPPVLFIQSENAMMCLHAGREEIFVASRQRLEITVLQTSINKQNQTRFL